jgi:alkyldihydroxyacetonephosphate synthase
MFRRAADPADTLHRWQLLKESASCSILDNGGTITHQHGVGLDHAKYLPVEKGELGMQLLNELCHVLDPERIMNPGKLLNNDLI